MERGRHEDRLTELIVAVKVLTNSFEAMKKSEEDARKKRSEDDDKLLVTLTSMNARIRVLEDVMAKGMGFSKGVLVVGGFVVGFVTLFTDILSRLWYILSGS